jgi:O-antigen ligase
MPSARKPVNRPAASPASAADFERWAWISRLAFYLLIALVCARAALTETIHDPLDVLPGTAVAPRFPGPATSLFLDLLCCVPALLVLLRRVVDSHYIIRWNWSHVLMAGLAAWMALSVNWAGDKFAAMITAANSVSAFVLLFSASQLVRSWLRLRLVAAAMFGLLLVYVAYGVNKRLVEFPEQVRQWNDSNSENSRWQYMKSNSLEENDFLFTQFEKKLRSGELSGFFTSPNTYGAMLSLLIIIAIGIVAQRGADNSHRGWIAAVAVALPGAAYVLWYTHSRTATLGLILALAMLAAIRRWRNHLSFYAKQAYWTFAALFLLGVLAVVGHGLVHHSLVDKSLTFRWYYWTGAARLVARYPLTGVGLANFGLRYPLVRTALAVEEVQDPHNFIAKAFAEMGLVGGLLTIAWIARLWWELTRPNLPRPLQRPEAKRPKRGVIVFASIAATAAALNLAIATDWTQDTNWFILQGVAALAGALLFLFGLCAAGFQSLGHEEFDSRPAPWLLYGLLVALGVFLLHNLIDFALSETGPLFVFALLAGSALGVRQPSLAGQTRKRRGPAAIFSLAVALWLAAGGLLWGRTAAAELSAAAGDRLFQSAATAAEPRRVDSRKLDDAFARYTAARADQPLNADYAYKAAQVLAYRDATTLFVHGMIAEAIQADPYRAKYFLFTANYELHQPRPDPAAIEDAYRHVLEKLDPRNVSVRLDYAAALSRLGQPAAAITQYREALRFDDELPKDEPKRLAPKKRQEIERKIEELTRRASAG